MKFRHLILTTFFITSIIPSYCQSDDRLIPFNVPEKRQKNLDSSYSEVTGEKMNLVSPDSGVDSFLDDGKNLMSEGKYIQAKEAFKTAIRLETMNEEAWNLYDEALIADYIEKRKDKNLEPVIDKDMAPIFEITNIDTYIELGTLYVVGSLKNLSNSDKHKIKVTAQILDKNEKELRRQTGELKLSLRGLSPNESSLFEIPFKNPPENAEKFRVKVSEYQ